MTSEGARMKQRRESATATVEPAGSTATVDDHEPAGILRRPWPFRRCPACGDDRFTVGAELTTAVFICVGCGASWRYLLGSLIRMASIPTPPVPLPDER